MARPKKEIDPEKVKQLAGMGMTVEEIAVILDCGKRTLETRFRASLKDGRLRMNGSLKRMQYMAAESGNAAMMIWLGKQYLGQRDTVHVEARAEVRRRVAVPDGDERHDGDGGGGGGGGGGEPDRPGSEGPG